jgi:hypothetical protein
MVSTPPKKEKSAAASQDDIQTRGRARRAIRKLFIGSRECFAEWHVAQRVASRLSALPHVF